MQLLFVQRIIHTVPVSTPVYLLLAYMRLDLSKKNSLCSLSLRSTHDFLPSSNAPTVLDRRQYCHTSLVNQMILNMTSFHDIQIYVFINNRKIWKNRPFSIIVCLVKKSPVSLFDHHCRHLRQRRIAPLFRSTARARVCVRVSIISILNSSVRAMVVQIREHSLDCPCSITVFLSLCSSLRLWVGFLHYKYLLLTYSVWFYIWLYILSTHKFSICFEATHTRTLTQFVFSDCATISLCLHVGLGETQWKK